MGRNLVILNAARAVADPIYIPAKDNDPRHNRTLVTAITNETRSGKVYSERHQLVFWGKAADSVAWSCGKGKGLDIVGRLHTYLHDTGRKKGNGKSEIYALTSINVREWNFSGFSKKEQIGNMARNIETLKAAGRIPAEFNVTPDELMAMNTVPRVDYNPAVHSNKYGNATVWAPNAVPAPAKTGGDMIDANNVEAMKARIKAIESGESAAKEAGAVQPFEAE
jgi:single-stranded DNA-binding protein